VNLLHKPAPAAIAKHGIATLTDNLAPGEFIAINRAFFNVFRPEFEARFIRGGKPCATSNSSSPCRSGK
jgi:hypothetical protein